MFINKVLAPLNIRITRKTTFDKLFQKAFYSDDYKQQVDVLLTSDLLRGLHGSKSQLEQRQDMFVLAQLNFKTAGYFVEFGAANGVDLSNTYLLEKNFGWSGILAEPSKSFHQNIFDNRNCHIEKNVFIKNLGKILRLGSVKLANYLRLVNLQKRMITKILEPIQWNIKLKQFH